MFARLIPATIVVAITPLSAGATTPYAARCEGNICYQGKVDMGCMRSEARRLMQTIADRFGKIEIASACDGRHARRSAHYVGKAFDFRPFQATRAEVVAYLKGSPDVGGVGTYSNGLIHADVGDRKMAWHGRGGRAWPIGIDRAPAGSEPIAVAGLAPSASPNGFAAALMAAFAPAGSGPVPGQMASTASPELPTQPDKLAAKLALRVPLPPIRPAILASISTDEVQSALAGESRGTVPASAPRLTLALDAPVEFELRSETASHTASFREIPPAAAPTFAASVPPATPAGPPPATLPGSDFMVALRGGFTFAELRPPAATSTEAASNTIASTIRPTIEKAVAAPAIAARADAGFRVAATRE